MVLMSDDFERPGGELTPPWDGVNIINYGEIAIVSKAPYEGNYHLEVILGEQRTGDTAEVYKDFSSTPLWSIFTRAHVRFVSPPDSQSCMFTRAMGELSGGMYTVPPNHHHPVLGVHLAKTYEGHAWMVRYWDGSKGETDNERRTDVEGPTFTVDPLKYYLVDAMTVIDDGSRTKGEIHLWVDSEKVIELLNIDNGVYGRVVEVRCGGRFIATPAVPEIHYIDNYLASEPYALTVRSTPLSGVPVSLDGIYRGETPLLISLAEGLHVVSVPQEILE